LSIYIKMQNSVICAHFDRGCFISCHLPTIIYQNFFLLTKEEEAKNRL
jgi:hypothetical protein